MVQGTQLLMGRTIAITRAPEQAEEAATLIEEMGGKPYFIPTISIEPAKDPTRVIEFIEKVARGEFDYVVFTSVNGVRYLIDASESAGLSGKMKRGLESSKVVAIGPRTAQELDMNGIRVGLIPERYTSEGLSEALQRLGVENKRIGIPRTSAASPLLRERLESMGASVEEVYVYESKVPADEGAAERFFKDLTSSRIDAIVFGSSLCAINLFKMLSGHAPAEDLSALLSSQVTVVAIGPVTAKTLREKGVRVLVIPESQLFRDALEALARYWNAK